MTKSFMIIIFALFVSACDNSYEAQRAKLEKLVKSNKIGSSSDAWLVKYGAAGPERIAIIFGFMDDNLFCKEIAELYMKKYPRDNYACEIAN